MVVDEFTEQDLSEQFDLHLLSPNDLHQIKPTEYAALFVETCFEGNRGLFTNFRSIDFFELLTKKFREAKVPTFFWYKEDQKTNTSWRSIASFFDYVLDAGDAGQMSEKAISMPFGVIQTRILKPSLTPTKQVVFAGGSYDKKFPDRVKFIKAIASNLEAGFGFTIHDRFSKLGLDSFADIQNCKVKSSVPRRELAKIFAESAVTLNINSVKLSKDFCSRRFFEIIETGGLPFSDFSLPIARIMETSAL